MVKSGNVMLSPIDGFVCRITSAKRRMLIYLAGRVAYAFCLVDVVEGVIFRG